MWMRTWTVIHKALSRSEASAQLRNNFKHVIEQNKIDHVWQFNQTNNQSFMRKARMLGPTKAHSFLQELISQIPLFWNYENSIHVYIKSREIEDYLKPEEN